MTPPDVDREIARLRAERERLRKALAEFEAKLPKVKSPLVREELTAQRDMMRAIFAQLTEELEAIDALKALRDAQGMGTIGSMDAVAPSQGGAVSFGKTKDPTLFQSALHKRGMSLPEWVATKKKFHLKPETAKNWVKRPGKGGRAVPRLWADRIAAEFGDPALSDPDNWPNGIRD